MMSKKIIFYGVLIVTASYSVQAQDVKTDTLITVSAQELSEGKQLFLQSDCAACHSPQNQLIGPSYVDIVKKYPLTNKHLNVLSQKIIKGGSGVWGQIPMAPHAALNESDAKKIVKYILSEF